LQIAFYLENGIRDRALVTFSLRLNGHFPGESGLSGVYWSNGCWKWWWQLEL